MSRPLLSSALLGPEARREECGLCLRRCSCTLHMVCVWDGHSGRGVCGLNVALFWRETPDRSVSQKRPRAFTSFPPLITPKSNGFCFAFGGAELRIAHRNPNLKRGGSRKTSGVCPRQRGKGCMLLFTCLTHPTATRGKQRPQS